LLRILIADDHAAVRRGVRRLIEAHPGWLVVAEASDGEQALAMSLGEKPDVAVLDVGLPVLDGFEVTRRLRQEAPNVRALLFTMHDDYETVVLGRSAGARGCVLKSDCVHELEAAISDLGANRPHFSPALSELLLDAELASHQSRSVEQSFTTRELEIARLITEGNTGKEIGQLLNISSKTVEGHRTTVMRKARVRTAADLARFAIKHRLV
jgi:DNA-binding NarL/FixJ family response regulator